MNHDLLCCFKKRLTLSTSPADLPAKLLGSGGAHLTEHTNQLANRLAGGVFRVTAKKYRTEILVSGYYYIITKQQNPTQQL
jgi:hypothetical protein